MDILNWTDWFYSEKRPKTEPFNPEDVFSESESESEYGSDEEDQIQSPQSDQNQPATKSDDVSDAVDALLAFKSLKPDIPEVKQVRFFLRIGSSPNTWGHKLS